MNNDIRRVLVTGANGHLGRRIVNALLAHGYRVFAHYRTAPKIEEFCPAGATPIIGNITMPQWMPAAFKNIDCIIHTAAMVSLRPGRHNEMYLVNVEGTKSVVRAAKAAEVKRLIHISSIAAVGGAREGQVLTEAAPFNLGHTGLPYFQTKFEAERAALAAANESFYVIILNPSIIIFPPDKEIKEEDLKKFRRWIPVYIDFGLNLVYADDVVAAVVNAVEKGRSGERYILGGENINPRIIFNLARKYLGIRKPVLKLPAALLYPVSLIYEIFYGFIAPHGKGPRLNRGVVRLARLRFHYSSEKAERELDFKVRSLDEIISSILSVQNK
jgi:dihydroflavonol-4-reductase